MIDISIIIPHKNSFRTLLRLLKTIPDIENIEVIVIDDKSRSTTINKLKNHKFKNNIRIIYSEANRSSGKARNIGIDNASGKWILFADADDYFSKEFLELTKYYLNNKEDVIYFGTNSVTELGDRSYRHLRYMKLVEDYLIHKRYEDKLRFCFLSPWGRMIKRELIEKYKIRFTESLSGNDNIFSVKVAKNAKNITATSKVLYIITKPKSSLSTIFSKDHFNSKFNNALKSNQLLRSINKSRYQQSILYFLGRSYKFGFKYFIYVIKQIIKYRANIFIGSKKILNIKEVLRRRE